MRTCFFNLGVITIRIRLESKWFQEGISQLALSRYGQALSLACDDAVIYIDWTITKNADNWVIMVGQNQYTIDSLCNLGIHSSNFHEEVSDTICDSIFQMYAGFHASAVSNQQGATYIFCGKNGVGKTTMVREFIRRGYKYVCDDFCAVDKKLTCFSFKTSLHLRVRQPNPNTHYVNGEYREFCRIEDDNGSVEQKVKKIIYFNSISDYETSPSIELITSPFQKTQLLNSVLLGYPTKTYIVDLYKRILTLPLYVVKLSRHVSVAEQVSTIEKVCI